MTTKLEGMVSGFDTQSIVNAYMATAKTSVTRLETKQSSEELKLKAYQAVNTYILKFKSAINTLSSNSLWNSKATVSTNEKVMTATANEYAVNGSYSFKVAQLATATQYMSKGVASKTDPLVELGSGESNYQLGSITLSSGKSRVDTSAELEKLNGGKGVYRGSVRITDASKNTAVVDLSSCVTMDDVVQKLNEASGIQINAQLEEGRLVIKDASGGSETMKITNVGTGTTATDLGIVGSSSTGEDGSQTINGRNVYTMGSGTALADLNDGLGVEEGIFYLRVYNSEGQGMNLGFDTSGCSTVGDLINKVNKTIEERSTGENANKYDEDLGMYGYELEGLTFGVSEDGTSFGLTGTKAGYSYSFLGNDTSSSSGKGQPVLGLGLYDETNNDAIKQTATTDGQELSWNRVLGGVNSPMLKNLGGANGTGVGTDADDSSNLKLVDFNESTKLSSLNSGKGLDLSSTFQMIIYPGGKDDSGKNYLQINDMVTASDIDSMISKIEKGYTTTQNIAGSQPVTDADGNPVTDDDGNALYYVEGRDATVGDLVDLVNSKINEYATSGKTGAAALTGMSVSYDAASGGLKWEGAQSGYEYEVYGAVANAVGLQRNPGSGTGSLGLERGTTYDNVAIQDFLNGDKLLQGNDSMITTGSDGSATSANMSDLIVMSGINRYNVDSNGDYILVDGEKVDNPLYVKDDGTFDSEGWLADCKDVLNGVAPSRYNSNNGTPTGYTSLADQFAGKTLTFDVTGANSPIEVEWDDVIAELAGDDGTVDWSKVSVADFVEAANAKISDAFEAYNTNADGTSNPTGQYIAAPTLTLNDNNDGLGWENVDFSKEWKVSDSVFTGLDFDMTDKSFEYVDDNGVTQNGTYNFAPCVDDPDNVAAAVNGRPLCFESGYYGRFENITNENAGEHKLSELNVGLGLTLNAAAGTNLILDITDANGTRKQVNVSVDAIIAELNGGDTSVDLNSKTVEDYIKALNKVTSSAISSEFGTGADAPSFTWGISDSGLSMQNVKNMSSVQFSADDIVQDEDGNYSSLVLGAGGTMTMGIGMAIGGGYNFDADGNALALDDDGNTITIDASVGDFNAVTYHESGITSGIGSIEMQVGNYGKVSLSTDGLTQESTLADLIGKLNDELDKLAANASTEEERTAYSDIRFVINDAGTGIAVDNTSNRAITFYAGVDDSGAETNNTLARDLGLVKQDETTGKVAAYTTQSAGSLNRAYISRATKLDDWLDGGTKGTLEMTDATGRNVTVDCSECETVGDLIDAINYWYNTGVTGIYAKLNDTGDGIDIIEQYNGGGWPDEKDRTSAISIKDQSSAGGVLAQKMGISGTAKENEDGVYELNGKLSKTIDVYANDSLQDIMYRVSEAGYKAAIINDGTSSNPYRLTISASATGAANDFVIDCDIDMLGFNMTNKGKDAKVLYGDPNSNSSPVMLTSDTNTNSSAILGLTLNMTSTSEEWTTITVDTDKDKVTEAIQEMVTTYNDLINVISQLDGYDEETGEEGILYRDSAVRGITESLSEYFYQIFDPKNLGMGSLYNGEQATWSWQDLGITLEAVNTSTDGSGTWYSQMILDEDKLADMVSSNWDTLQAMMHSETNVGLATGTDNVRASASFSGALAAGYDDATYAANGNSSKGTFGNANGIMAEDTIANGANTYTLIFPQAQTVSRYSILHASKDTALKDYKVEYLDAVSGEWKELRSISGNTSDSNYMAVNPPVSMSGMRIVASDTNAEDGKFRLLDFQVYSGTGLADGLNQYVNSVGDTTSGFLATQTTEIENNISQIESQISSLQARLDAKEANLWKKFTAMEVALGNLSNQSNYISSMLGSSSSSSSS